MAAVMAAMSMGCHRQFYRKQADCEAHSLINEKSLDVARPPNTVMRIEVDRRSRMFNPFDLDFQPMPLDDPASYQYMQCVDGRRGYPMWEAAGLTNVAENPDWWQFLPLDDDGVLVLNAENAVRIARLHSPVYQARLEQLYFTALDVSGQRFVFDTNFFGGAGAFWNTTGRRSNGGQSSTQFGLADNSLSLQRNLATGGQLLAGIANSIVWELSGPNTQSANTVIDFTLLQPLLRGAGRDVALESLTQAERSLLAEVRAFERFRRSFFLNVTIGRQLEQINALAGVGNIGFNAGGFVGLLQTQLQIRNSEENIARQKENLLILEDTLIELLTKIPEPNEAGQIVGQRLQVAQARSQLVRSQSSLVAQQAAFQASVDQFLATLGLPPYVCARIDDPLLDQFQLIDQQLLTRREELSTLRANAGDINVAILDSGEYVVDPDTGVPVSQMESTPQLAELLEQLRTELRPLAAFVEQVIEKDLPVIEEDIELLGTALADREGQIQNLEQLYRTERDSICGLLNLTEIDESIFEFAELSGLGDELSESFAAISQRLEAYEQKINALEEAFLDVLEAGDSTTDPKELAQKIREDIVLRSQDLVAELGDDVLELQLIQARARTESVVLPEVDIQPETAFQIARKNRRDWANARAELVDAWRAIEVAADDLESDLDLVFAGDVRNDGNSPLSLRSTTGSLRMGLQWDAPITRLLERNNYRTTQIVYEQTKRAYYQFEDGIWRRLRAEVRQLQANRLTFELGRQSVRLAAEQISLNADRRAFNEARGQGDGPTAARDAIDALAALLDAQNGLLSVFVSYEVVRRGLDIDLGTMELTPEGLWIDPGELSPDTLLTLAGTTEGGMIEACNDCCLPYRRLPQEPEYEPFYPAVRGQDQRAGTPQAIEASEINMPDGNRPVDGDPTNPDSGQAAGQRETTWHPVIVEQR